MRNILKLFLAASFLCIYGFIGCSQPPKAIPKWEDFVTPGGSQNNQDNKNNQDNQDNQDNKDNKDNQDHNEILSSTDMVLIYGGGHHRSPYSWSKDMMKDYVVYTDKSNKSHWLFDSFLLLEFMDPAVNGGPGKTLVTGYKYKGSYMQSANKDDWGRLIDYYCSKDSGAGAIDKAVGDAKVILGEPASARTIVVGIPEPITCLYSATHSGGTSYWGEINGEQLDFSNRTDRVRACKWYVDKVVEKFKAMKYKNIKLAGFYWVAEQSGDTKDMLFDLAAYINSNNYSFNWIPYYRAAGYADWRSYGFNFAYLQPNYFFNKDVPYERLNSACAEAELAGMDMELEFDDNALVRYGRGYKLRDYMKAFKEHGVWKNRRLAYYQGGWSVRSLKNSSDPQDNQLYHDFCDFVISRPIRDKHK